MALGFAGFVAGTLADRGWRSPIALLLASMAVSVGSVLLWADTGNLVPYLVDCEIFEFLRGTVSGHTIKHLLAAAAILVLDIMVRTRRPPSASVLADTVH
jgi:hypothetical protein